MADEKHLYRYTSNKDPNNGTETIIVEDANGERATVPRGGEVELTEDQATDLRSRFNLTKLSEEQAAKAESDDDQPKRSRRAKPPARGDAGEVSVEGSGGVDTANETGSDPAVDDGQGSRGASGQDVGTTTGGTR